MMLEGMSAGNGSTTLHCPLCATVMCWVGLVPLIPSMVVGSSRIGECNTLARSLLESRYMNRKERRRAKRKQEKLRKQREKEAAKLSLVRRFAKAALNRIWALILAVATLI